MARETGLEEVPARQSPRRHARPDTEDSFHFVRSQAVGLPTPRIQPQLLPSTPASSPTKPRRNALTHSGSLNDLSGRLHGRVKDVMSIFEVAASAEISEESVSSTSDRDVSQVPERGIEEPSLRRLDGSTASSYHTARTRESLSATSDSDISTARPLADLSLSTKSSFDSWFEHLPPAEQTELDACVLTSPLCNLSNGSRSLWRRLGQLEHAVHELQESQKARQGGARSRALPSSWTELGSYVALVSLGMGFVVAEVLVAKVVRR